MIREFRQQFHHDLRQIQPLSPVTTSARTRLTPD
jgi:hypothetical protein